VDDASLVIKQRERKQLPVVWQLLFCRLFNESAYRHLDLRSYNLPACRNPQIGQLPEDLLDDAAVVG